LEFLMTTWHVEYESMNSGFQRRKIVAGRMAVDKDFVTFWEGLTPVFMVNTMHLVTCLQLADGGPVRLPASWRPPRDEEEVFVPPREREDRLRVRYTDRLETQYASDPIGDVARDAAKRLAPKVTSALTPTAPTPPTYSRFPLRDAAPGELGAHCA
jgi:hypothetical protein